MGGSGARLGRVDPRSAVTNQPTNHPRIVAESISDLEPPTHGKRFRAEGLVPATRRTNHLRLLARAGRRFDLITRRRCPNPSSKASDPRLCLSHLSERAGTACLEPKDHHPCRERGGRGEGGRRGWRGEGFDALSLPPPLRFEPWMDVSIVPLTSGQGIPKTLAPPRRQPAHHRGRSLRTVLAPRGRRRGLRSPTRSKGGKLYPLLLLLLLLPVSCLKWIGASGLACPWMTRAGT